MFSLIFHLQKSLAPMTLGFKKNPPNLETKPLFFGKDGYYNEADDLEHDNAWMTSRY